MGELIEHGVTGYLVDDIDSAVAAVAAAGELDRRTIAERAADRFTVATMIDKYVNVYRDVIGDRKEWTADATPLGGSLPSSTRSIRAASPTRTATASVISVASSAGSTIVQALGVDVIWLSPIYRSPQADNGYDISDYRDIDPMFGTLAEFDVLLAKVHELRDEAGDGSGGQPHLR